MQANRNGFSMCSIAQMVMSCSARIREERDVGIRSHRTRASDSVPNMEPTPEGRRVCPSLEGASNWYSTPYNPATGLYYVQTNDKCGVFTKIPMEWAAGRGYMGGSFMQAPDEPAQRVLRAIDIQTGKAAWEVPQVGPVTSWGGTLSTASGVVFFGDDSGSFAAVDATNGKPLWSFRTNQNWKASPMTYSFDNRQFIAVASGRPLLRSGCPTDLEVVNFLWMAHSSGPASGGGNPGY